MNKTPVAIVPCDSYEKSPVEEAVERAIALIPEPLSSIKPASSVVLKIDLEDLHPPADALTTHPSLVQAAAWAFRQRGFGVTIGEGAASVTWPLWRKIRHTAFEKLKDTMKGKPYPELMGMYRSVLESRIFQDIFSLEIPGVAQPIIHLDELGIDEDSDFFSKAGIREAAQRAGALLSFFETEEFGLVRSRTDLFLTIFHLCKVISVAGRVVSMPKPREGPGGEFLGAVRNFIGTVPTALRETYVTTARIAAMVPQMHVDIFSAVVPAPLALIDAIEVASGAEAGPVRRPGLLIAAADCVAADTVCALVSGRDPLAIPELKIAQEKKLGVGSPAEMEIRGLSLDEAKKRWRDR
jgi:uncharacterized protein (DUF362 family)